MGFRLQRRVRIAPGLTMNISKRGLGMSVGPRGAKFSVGPRGRRESVGIPGTGMRYEVRQDWKKGGSGGPAKKKGPQRVDSLLPGSTAPAAANVGFLAKAFKQPFEKSFIEGAQCLSKGDQQSALAHFQSAAALNPACIDADLLSALMLINRQDYSAAAACLEKVTASGTSEFPLLSRYLGADGVHFDLPITEEVTADLRLDLRAAYLTLAEVYQQQGRLKDAVAVVRQAVSRGYSDPVVRLSLIELYNDLEMDEELVAAAQGTENTDNVSLAIMFYLGQAMMRKGYYDAALTVLKAALAKRKDRSETLLLDTRYVLAQVYEKSGKKAMARKQYEQILAKDYAFRDAKTRVDELSAT
jgi:tetratricopeptide (TPR) repeat protein